jgi:putative transposase
VSGRELWRRRCAGRIKRSCRPTPTQERAQEHVLWRCCTLFNTALEQRITAWQRCRVSVTHYQQEAELKNIRAKLPEYAAMHCHVVQDVLARLDKTYQAFFRRLTNRETPGFPRFQGANRYHSFAFKAYGNGARLENGYLVLSKIGRIAVRWSRPVEGTIKTSPSPKWRTAGTSASRVRMCPPSRCHRPAARLT